MSQVIGSMAYLVVTLPGQTFADDTTKALSGNTGTPTNRTAGTSFNISRIRATDQFFNVITSYAGAKTIAYTGPSGSLSTYTTAVTFTAGLSSTTLATNLSRAETATITATDGGLFGLASSAVTVNPGAFVKMQLIVPGETADPGSASGKTGTATTQTAGTGFAVTVNAVDANWNLVSTAPANTVSISTTDPNDTHPLNAPLSSGTRNFTVTFKTAGSSTVTASNVSDGTKTSNTSPLLTVNPGSFSKLQLLVPGESADPGTPTGKAGNPSARTAGSSFSVTVNAVDDNWNLISSAPANIITLTSNDGNAVMPASAPLSSGSVTFAAVTLRTAGSSTTITSSNTSDGSKSADSSPAILVNPGAFTKLQIILPGETANPGSASGKIGTPDIQTAGILFNVTVNAVDDQWNVVNSVTDVVHLSSTDVSAVFSPDASLVNGTLVGDVNFGSSGTFTVTASDVTDGGKGSNTSPSITVNPAGSGLLTPASGGESISADDAGISFTPLTGPAYDEGQNANITSGTIILNVSTGFVFDVGGTAPTLLITRISGSGANSRNINSVPSGTAIAATSRTSTQIIFTITNASNNGVKNSVTWQNIRVRPSSGSPLASGNITVSGTSTIAGVNGSTNFGTLTQVSGAMTKLVITLPGETFNEGSGNSGTPLAQTAGSTFDVTSIRATDQFFNTVTSYSGLKTIGYSGPGGSSSSFSTSVNFTAGVSTTMLSTTLTKSEATTLTATDGGQFGHPSATLTVNPASFTKMQILLPGETASPGSASGKTGTPSDQTAGTGFAVTVNAVDAYWNLVTAAPAHTIALTSDDINAVMPSPASLSSGTVTFATVSLPTAGSFTVTATNSTDGSKTADVSPSVTNNSGIFVKLQILVPGETADPGSVSGKSGTPDNQASGAPISVTVNAVDANWNLVPSTDVIQITSSDGAATLPANDPLIAGSQNFIVTLNTSGLRTITASNVTNGSITANTSPSINVSTVVITAATGGAAISVDDVGGVYTSLTGPSYEESGSGNVGAGTFILNAPTGFSFDVGGVAPTVLITRLSGGGNNSRNINGLASGTSAAISSIDSTKIVFTITSASSNGVRCELTWQNIRIRPTFGYPLVSGDLTKTGTSTVLGIVNGSTSFGVLNTVVGAVSNLVVTLPGETFSEGTGNSGTPDEQVENVPFVISSITATDQFLNIVQGYSPPGAISYSGPSGSPSYTTAVSFSNGVSTTILTTTLTAIEVTSITAGDGILSGPASSSINVKGAVKTWDGGGGSNNWSDANNWNPNGVPTSSNDVTLTGSITVNINVPALAKDFLINDAGTTVTILSGNSLTVNGNLSQSEGLFKTETGFPAVSGTSSLSGGTFEYSATGGTQNIESQSYYHLTVSGGGTKSAAGTVIINGDLSVAASTVLDDNGFQIIGNASGSVTIASGGVISLGNASTATEFPTNFISGNVILNSTSTVIFSSDQPQNINALNYGNLSSTGSGSRTLPAGQTVGISGTFAPGANSYTVSSGTVNFNGSGSQTIPAFNFYNLTSSSTGTRTLAGSGTIGIAGSFTPGSNDYIIASSIVDFNGNGAQTIPSFNYHSLRISGSRTSNDVTFSGSDTISIADSLMLAATFSTGSYSSAGSTIAYNGNGSQTMIPLQYYKLIISGSRGSNNVTIATSDTIKIARSFDIIATFSGGSVIAAGSTLDFNGTIAQTIPSMNYHNLRISGSRGNSNVTLAPGIIGVANTYAPNAIFSGGTYVATSNTMDFNGTGNQTIPSFRYYDLKTSGGGTKSAGGSLIVTGDVVIGAGSSFDAGSSTDTIYGDWTTAGVFSASSSTIIFAGSQGSSIIGPTVFNALSVNKTAAATAVTLMNDVTADVLNMLNGTMHTGSNKVTITSSRSGSGIIIGTVERSHVFALGTPYEFESPDTRIVFTSGTPPTAVTMTVISAAPSSPTFVAVNRSIVIGLSGGSGLTSTVRFHYENSEANNLNETILKLWQHSGSWQSVNTTAYDSVNNYIEVSGLTSSIAGNWGIGSSASTKSIIDLNGGSPLAGDSLQYTITITNPYKVTKGSIVVTDPMDDNVIVRSATISDGGSVSGQFNNGNGSMVGGTILWPSFSLVSGASASRTFVAQTDSLMDVLELINNVASIDFGGGVVENVAASVTISNTANIAIDTNIVSNQTPVPGDTLIFTLKYRNTGTSNATSVTASYTIPGNTNFMTDGYGSGMGIQVNSTAKTNAADADEVSVSGSTITIAFPTLSPGAYKEVKFKTIVN